MSEVEAKIDLLISFERQVSELWEEGQLPYLLHLSSGNEKVLVDYFQENVRPGDWIFSSHRNHYHSLLAGIPEAALLERIKSGKSMFSFDRERHFFSSAILAGQACIAVGVAWDLKHSGAQSKVHCFLGDGAEEEGHFYEAVMMVESHSLPCTFIIEDNDRQVDTSLAERAPTKFRMDWPDSVVRMRHQPQFPHAGNGTSKMIEFKKK